jgi:hypothetical protein
LPSVAVIGVDSLANSPEWLPLDATATAALRLIRLDEAAYRNASFLDQRLLGQGYAQDLCEPAALEAAASRLRMRAHYIFHTGHVGSTLVSRLVGAQPGFFSLREPAVLRTLALRGEGESGPRLEAALALLSRTWHPGQRAVVKATSFVSELAAAILAADQDAAAIFMFVDAAAYLRGILAGPNSRAEIRQLGALRRQRLARRLGPGNFHPDPRSEGEWIAMSWLCEMTALGEAADRFGTRVLWVDFDRFLAEPRSQLAAILGALGSRPAPDEVEKLVTGPLMTRYSKAPEFAYDAALRRQVMRSADLEHADEIRNGIGWLQQWSARHPLARRAFEMSAAGRL